jgi:hypothetical protein
MLVWNPWVKQTDEQFKQSQEVVQTNVNKSIWVVNINNNIDWESLLRWMARNN